MRLRKSQKVEAIRKVPLFSKLSKKALEAIASTADEMDFPAGKALTKEGEPGREFFVLLDGSAEVRKEGKQVASLGPGDFFGEIALVTKVPRTATVTTTSEARALVLTDRDFAALLKRSPEVGQGVLAALGERLASDLG